MHTFDLRSSLLSFSLLRITNAFDAMKSGEEMEIIAGRSPTDKATLADIKRILPRGSYDIVCDLTPAQDESAIVLRLRKNQS